MSYNEKHNEANGEDNRDGESHNRSWNCGVEGPTDDPEILALRGKQMRNIMATLMLSQGTPMIAHGDEIGRTQRGNNNVYCQDSEMSWMDWSLCETNADLLEFTRKVTELRKNHPVFRRRRFFDGKPIRTGDQVRDIAWSSCIAFEHRLLPQNADGNAHSPQYQPTGFQAQCGLYRHVARFQCQWATARFRGKRRQSGDMDT